MLTKFLIFITLLGLGFFFGKKAEADHLKSIISREKQFADFPLNSYLKKYPNTNVQQAKLAQGAVVISIDFFKKTVASIINLIGGNITTYESLIERARREAILRLQESCADADEIINVRIETSSITKGDSTIGSIEVLAYGTAIYLKKN